MHFFRCDGKHIEEKAAVTQEHKTEMGQELLLGEGTIEPVNTVEDDRDSEYTCSEKPTGQTAQLEKAK